MTDLLDLRIDSLAFGGEAVGRAPEGQVIFVPDGAPGDLVRVRVLEVKARFGRAELLEVLEAGPGRVTPPCALAARCGGCPWQHVSSEVQRGAKQEIVARALRHTGAEVRPIRHGAASLGYRTRARMRRRGGAFGFSMRRSHEVIDVPHCPALDPRLDQALQTARRALGPALGEEAVLAGVLGADGAVQLQLEAGQGAARSLEGSAAALVGEAGVVGVMLRRGQKDRSFGAAQLEVGDGFRSAADGFQQGNAALNTRLREEVAAAAEAAGASVLELYAGDGNFTRDLAQVAARGVAVEGDRAAAARLGENLRRSGASGWELRAQPAEVAVAQLQRAGARFDVAVLDPPRAGARAALVELAALAPDRIIYISCDPMTLARDLAELGRRAYAVAWAQPYDLLPQTAHVEVVVRLDRLR